MLGVLIVMKIGIITLVSDNYGNKFQNYAVEQIFSQHGEVETFKLDNLYVAPANSNGGVLKKLTPKHIKNALTYRLMYKYDLNRTDKGLLYNILFAQKNSTKLLELKKERSERFNEFSKKELHISPKILNRENTTKDWVDNYGCFVCGSDQIWNPTYATTSELAFCSFAPEKTICLSPSFGVSQIPDYRTYKFSRWLNNIPALSVREEAGQKIIKDLTGRDAEVLLDPTMLISIDEWNNLIKKPENNLPEKYVLCYFLGKFDKHYSKKVNDFAKKHNLPVVMLFDIMSPEYYTFDPAEVLYAIKNAEYVLTDSFHGSVFSILFHKNFYVFNRNEGGSSMNSRLETLLKKFNLKERFNLNDGTKIDIDTWEYADNILETEKAKAKEYITNILGNG